MSAKKFRYILKAGEIVGDYTVISLIGQGGFGDIYKVAHIDTKKEFAMKIEEVNSNRKGLENERNIIKNLNSKCFVKFIDYGEDALYKFLIQDLCGPSFSALRRILPEKKFSTSTVLRIGLEMLRAIKKLHKNGYIHCDIKPSNFLLQSSRRHPVALIDFGLCYKYMDPQTGVMEKPRIDPGQIGTPRYMSPYAHLGTELGRRDDLFSWFFTLVEMNFGSVPWGKLTDRDQIYNFKKSMNIAAVTKGMPKQMVSIYRVIRRMNQDEEPDYSLIMSFLNDAILSCGATWDDPYDWDLIDLSAISSIPIVISQDDKSKIPEDLPIPILPEIELAFRTPYRPMYSYRRMIPIDISDDSSDTSYGQQIKESIAKKKEKMNDKRSKEKRKNDTNTQNKKLSQNSTNVKEKSSKSKTDKNRNCPNEVSKEDIKEPSSNDYHNNNKKVHDHQKNSSINRQQHGTKNSQSPTRAKRIKLHQQYRMKVQNIRNSMKINV